MSDFEQYPQNEIGERANVPQFGSEFSYATWTPDTKIMLCNVPWNSDYRDVAHFESKAELNAFLNDDARSGPRVDIARMTYIRPGTPIRINLPFNAAYLYNYVRVVNGAQPVTANTTNSAGGVQTHTETQPQTLYYFVTDVRYVAPNTTEIQVQLDVWQSFIHNVTFGNCYIERGHIGIANENQFSNWGRDYLTVPEGLDIGNEYVISKTAKHVIAAPGEDGQPTFSVMVISTTSLVGPYGDVNAPILTVASGSAFDGLPNGCDLYVFSDADSFTAYMDSMKDKPWVTQGIVSVTAIPDSITNSFTGGDVVSVTHESVTFNRVVSGSSSKSSVWPDLTGTPAGPLYGNMRDTRYLSFGVNEAGTNFIPWRDDIIPARYKNLKKFLTSPYMVVELTTYSGNPLVLKPENMPGDNMRVIQKMYFGTPSPRMVFMPYKYNAPSLSTPNEIDEHGAIVNDGGEMFDMMTGIFNYPTFSIVNNGYMGYMASNKNNIAYQHSSADWSQDRARSGAVVAANNATRGADLSQRLAGVGNRVINDSAAIAQNVMRQRAMLGAVNSGVGMVGSAIQGSGAGVVSGAMGMANTAANYTIDADQNVAQTAVTSQANTDSSTMSRATADQTIDTNRKYAEYAASGDYQNAIAGINARVQDAKMIQPTTAGQVGGDAFNLAMFRWGVFAKVKTLQPAMIAAIGDYWLRYGYAVNRFGQMPSDYRVMEKFTYWKLRETYIQSSTCPELFRQTLRGIFEKGVTVWSDANNIGMIDIANNEPLEGIEL